MHQFVVPQFIDVEDKIIGPITTRQFIILMVGGFFVFIEYKLFDFTLFALLGIITVFLAGVLSFFKVNGMPVHYFLLNFITSFQRPKTRVWQKEISDQELKLNLSQPVAVARPAVLAKPLLAKSRLTQLSMLVDTGGMYQGEEDKINF